MSENIFCTFDQHEKGSKCLKCGRSIPVEPNGLFFRRCKIAGGEVPTSPPEPQPELLGDWTERQLKKLGVTPESYSRAKELFGLSPNCNCGKRKKTLNQWHKQVREWWATQG